MNRHSELSHDLKSQAI